MADSAVAVTAGTGTNIDTRTESTNGNHRAVVVLGDPATNAGVAPVDATSGLKVDLGADNDVVVSDGGNVISIDDASGSITVDGSVTATLAAGTNTNEVVGDVAQDAAVAGNPLLVGGRASSAAPTDMSADGDSVYLWTTLKGALNVADAGGTLSIDDGAGNISIDDGGNTITVDGTVAVTNAGLTALNGAISGTEVQVDIVSMPSIGTVDLSGDTSDLDSGAGSDAHDVVAIGVAASGGHVVITGDASNGLDVDVTRVGGTVAVTQSGTWDEVGINDSGNSITVDGTVTANLAAGTNNIGDVDILTIAAGDNNIGNVDIVTMPSVTIGTMANLTESLADDAAFTPATSRVLPSGFTFDDTTPDSVNEGDIGAARMSANRNIYVNIRDNAGNERGLNVDSNGELGISAIRSALPAGTNAIGKLAANSGVDIGDVDILSIAAGDNNIGNVDIVTMPDATVVGKAAHDAAVSGNPILLGGYASAAAPTDVSADGDVARLWTTVKGALNVADGGSTLSIDDGSSSITVDNGGTFATQATLQTGDNTVGRVKLSDGTDIADILDLTNSNPLAVAIVDTSGDQISSFGGGTQYTEDAAAAANPVGTALILVREDGRAGSLTTTDGDNVAARGNNKGELYVKTTDSDALLTTIDTDTSNISTKIDTVAGAVSGTEMQVDVLTMPTVTVTATNLDVQSGGADLATTTQAGAIQTSVELIDDAIKADDAAFTPATTKVMMAGFEYDDTTPDSVDEGDSGAARMSANRNIYTTIRDAAGNERGVNVNASNQLSVSVDNTVTVASHAVTNAGTFVTQENGSALTALQLIDDGVYTDDTSTHSTGTSKGYGIMAAAAPTDTAVNANDIGMVGMTVNRALYTSLQDAIPAGTNAIGKLAANSGVDIGDVDVTSIAAGTNLIGDVGTQPRTSNGLTTKNSTSSDGGTALTSTAQAIKASAGLLYGYYIYNPNSSAAYVQFYNTAAASVTVGTTNPLFMLTIPASSAANLMMPIGITFSNAGWSWAATSTAGGNGAPTTSLDAVAFYN